MPCCLQIDDEDRYSEGNWQIRQEEERRAREELRQWEIQQYELMTAQQEADREVRSWAISLQQMGITPTSHFER